MSWKRAELILGGLRMSRWDLHWAGSSGRGFHAAGLCLSLHSVLSSLSCHSARLPVGSRLSMCPGPGRVPIGLKALL